MEPRFVSQTLSGSCELLPFSAKSYIRGCNRTNILEGAAVSFTKIKIHALAQINIDPPKLQLILLFLAPQFEQR